VFASDPRVLTNTGFCGGRGNHIPTALGSGRGQVSWPLDGLGR